MVLVIVLLAGCAPVMQLSAKQVLERSVANLLALKCYRYRGTSSMRVAADARLDNDASFDTMLVQNGEGGLDGHMVVKSPGYSYETYSYGGTEYTRVSGSGLTHTVRGSGYGMVSTGARRVVAEFAALVDDIKMEAETARDFTISMVMGEKYRLGAVAISAAVNLSGQSAGGSSGGTRMTLVVGKDDLRIKSVIMSVTLCTAGTTPDVTITTRGIYSDFNRPAGIEPPPAALNSPEVSAGSAPAIRQF